MFQGWIACALGSVIVVCLGVTSLSVRSELRDRVNILEAELHAMRSSIDSECMKDGDSEFYEVRQSLVVGKYLKKMIFLDSRD